MPYGISIGRRRWSGRIASLPLFCVYLFDTNTGHTSGPILTIYTSYDVFSCKDVPFGGSVDISPHWGKILKNCNFGAWIGILKPNVRNRPLFKGSYYQNYCMDFNQILQTSKDHQMWFTGGPEMRQSNPRWRMAATLKMGKSWYLCNRLTNFDEIWHGDASGTSTIRPPLRLTEFENAILKIEKLWYLNRLTDFDKI